MPVNEKRPRNWACCVYPESAPENWLQMLDDMHIPALVSPLHDKDINADGTSKKPHWHVLLLFEGHKTASQVQDCINPFNGTIPIPIQSAKAYARYLTHQDNPEKHQYSKEDVRSFGGVDYDKLCDMTTAMRHSSLRQMRKFIRENNIYSFAAFYDYCDDYQPDWAAMLDDNSTMCISNYIKSRIYDLREAREAEREDSFSRRRENVQNVLKNSDPFVD